MRIESKCLHEGWKPKNGEPHALPIYQSTTYNYDSTEHIGDLFDLKAEGYFYTRLANPTVGYVEEKFAALEGGVGAMCT
uniref:PLP-dependent transferase n=1 Tax=Christensenella hongkongensis TaxID=270498 RepID=UPI0026720690